MRTLPRFRSNPPQDFDPEGTMDIETYLWYHRISTKTFAEAVGITYPHLMNIAKRRATPNLVIAVRIHELTFGKVALDSMLSDDMRQRLDEMRCGLRKKIHQKKAATPQPYENSEKSSSQKTAESA